MIIKREKLIMKHYGPSMETYKRTSYWLFGIIPLYIGDKFLKRE